MESIPRITSQQQINPRLLNRIAESLNGIGRMTATGGIQLSKGRSAWMLTGATGDVTKSMHIFEVQSEAAGDGIYNCYEQLLDATEWADTAGDPKFDDKNTTSVEVLNLAEFDPEADYTAMLSAGDMLAAWRMTDDEGNKRWVGIPLVETTKGAVHIAYCKNDAGAASTITCYLDADETGDEILVGCSIAGTGDKYLNSAIPRLQGGTGEPPAGGTAIFVTKIGVSWVCTTVFQASENCDCYSA